MPAPDLADEPVEAPERFFLVCNQFWKHKNHLVIFRALRLLHSRGVRPLILCTGQLDDYRDRAHADSIRAELNEGGIAAQVEVLGLIPRRRQLALMRRTLAVIQPSLFEGWSTVVEDARVLGRATVLSDIDVHREQAPPGARYFDPNSPEALADVLADLWTNGTPGPNRDAEQAAAATARDRLAEVGREFLRISTR